MGRKPQNIGFPRYLHWQTKPFSVGGLGRPVAYFYQGTNASLGEKTAAQNPPVPGLPNVHSRLSEGSESHFSLVTKKSMDIHLFDTRME
jgi:hypothetical protein